MSNELAEKVLRIKDQNQVRDLLAKQRNQIDNTFVSHLLDKSNQYKQDQKYEAAISVLRTLFTSGQVTGNTYITALSLLQVAYVEIARRSFDRSVNMIERCIAECDKVSDSRCVELKARAYRLLGQLQYQQYDRRDAALRSLQEAAAIYDKLQKTDAAASIRATVREIAEQPQEDSSKQPLSDVLDEIAQSRSVLANLRSDLEKGTSELDALTRHRDALQSQVQGLAAQHHKLDRKNAQLQDQLSKLNRQIAKVQKRIDFMSTAQQIPLWAAAIRAEIDDGEITGLTLPLLSKLKNVQREYAEALIIEIRARNGIQSGDAFDLSGLSGEQRLFAGIANANQREQVDKIEASEMLLDAWETYLSTMDGNIQ